MSPSASVVAYYGEKQPGLASLITQVQDRACGALGHRFHRRDLAEVHATIIGLENVSHGARMSDLLTYLRTRFDRGMTFQFGGFADADYPLNSRGSRLYQRSFTISRGDVMLMGWPVEGGVPSAALDDVRRECNNRGFAHKYYSVELPVDPDCYLSVGRLDGACDVDVVEPCERQLRQYLSGEGIQVPLASQDISIVLYEDRSLARASSTVYSL